MSTSSLISRLNSAASIQPEAQVDEARQTVAILMCTYNGQDFLEQQLQSIAAQSHSQWKVVVSDDGSDDDTLPIIQRYQASWGRDKVSVRSGPKRGFAANFLSLVCRADIEADYFAYSDQDDVWEPAKLDTALNWLKSVPSSVPALYCSRTRLVDAQNKGIGLSQLFSKPPCFANALMQNIAGGNTMVFNAAARALLLEAGQDVQVVAHDWWTYLVITGCNGRVLYDPNPTVLYRQHETNLVGVNGSLKARLMSVRLLLAGKLIDWNDRNIDALLNLQHRLTPENREIAELFTSARQRLLLPRLVGLKRSGIYRQTWLGNLGLLIVAIFRKI
jgi:glycosyltransferase involved in cell wall biosynthesis